VTLVIDASVACKWYLDEPLSDAARALADGDDLFAAPELVLTEVGNVLWRRLRAGDIGLRQAREAARHLPIMFAALTPANELLPRALDLAADLDHPVYDCMYLATAERCDAPLVTADDRLWRAVQGRRRLPKVRHLRDGA
jgi:predicted nucleic acid-binding protein